jgi:hypothetical protein
MPAAELALNARRRKNFSAFEALGAVFRDGMASSTAVCALAIAPHGPY